MSKVRVYYTIGCVIIIAAYLIGTDNLDIRVLRAFSRSCQATARVVGTWGMKSERLYLAILDQGRMI